MLVDVVVAWVVVGCAVVDAIAVVVVTVDVVGGAQNSRPSRRQRRRTARRQLVSSTPKAPHVVAHRATSAAQPVAHSARPARPATAGVATRLQTSATSSLP